MKDMDNSLIEALNKYGIKTEREFVELEELHQYRSIGTVEECREARGKQVPQNPTVLVNDHDVKIGNVTFRKGTKTYKCKCGSFILRWCNYCPDCGQMIDWE